MKLLLLILLFIILYPIIKGWMAMKQVVDADFEEIP